MANIPLFNYIKSTKTTLQQKVQVYDYEIMKTSQKTHHKYDLESFE